VERRFEPETQRLIKSWTQYDRSLLRDYLVQDVQDPRINIQSILTRHFLINRLLAGQFQDLMEQELRFALVINWVQSLLKTSVRPHQLHAVLGALFDGEDHADGLAIPSYISETFAGIAVPNYMCDLLTWAPVETTEVPIAEYIMDTFKWIWREQLEGKRPDRISVVEPACGSANDYRFIGTFGIARLLDYTGFDLCKKNVRNATAMFGDVQFEQGNILEIDVADNAFDYCFVNDLFEHLSVEAMELAVAEVCRVTRRDICVGFFNMHPGDRHIVKVVRDYHWNTLSLPRTKEMFERNGSAVEVVHIDSFLQRRFGCNRSHNKAAYTFIIRM
jgi:hypothetical protein